MRMRLRRGLALVLMLLLLPGAALGEKAVLRLSALAVYLDEPWSDTPLRAAIRLFEEARPGVRVQADELPREQVTAALLAGEESLDIFLVDTYALDGYIGNAVLADLTDAVPLDAWRDSPALARREGRLWAVPLSVDVRCLYTDAAVLREAGFPYAPEEIADLEWEELYAACAAATRASGIPVYCESARFPMPVLQYVASFAPGEAITFDTEEFRAVLALLRKTCDEGAVRFAPLALSGLVDSAITHGLFSGAASAGEGVALPPRLHGEDHYACTIAAMAVNARSAQKDLATELLGVYASAAAQAFDAEASRLRDTGAYPQETRPTMAQEALWSRACAALGEVSAVAGTFGKALGDEMEAFLQGRTDAEALIGRLDELMAMVYMG